MAKWMSWWMGRWVGEWVDRLLKGSMGEGVNG